MILAFIGTTTALLFWELVKLFVLQIFKSQAPKATIALLQQVDRLLPSLIREGVSGEELEERLRNQLGELTGQQWNDVSRSFNLSAFLEHQRHGNSN